MVEKPTTQPEVAAQSSEHKNALEAAKVETEKQIKQDAEKQTVKSLENLARDIQLNRLKETEKNVVSTILALPDSLDIENATAEQLATLDTFHMGSLFLIREILKTQPNIQAESIEGFFKADVSNFKETEKALWNKLKNIAANKDTYPKLYQDLFGKWAEGIAVMKQKVEAEKPEQASESASNIKEEEKEGNLFDKVLEVAKQNPLLATIGAVGLGIALYHMWKNGGWQKAIVVGLFGLVGVGALTSESAKDLFGKIGVDTDKEDTTSTPPITNPNTPDIPQNSPQEEKEKEGGWKPLREVYGTVEKDIKMHMDSVKGWMENNKSASMVGGLMLAKNDIASHFLGGGASLGITTMLALGKLPFAAATSHPIGSTFAVMAFMMHKDKAFESIGDIQVPSTPEAMKKYLIDKKDEINKFCIDRDLTPLQDKDVEKVVDLITGKVTIEQILPKGMEFGEMISKGILDYIGSTPEETVQTAFRDGLKNFNRYLNRASQKEPDAASIYQSISDKVEKLITKTKGNGITVEDIDSLQKIEELAPLGMRIYMENGYIRVAKVDSMGIMQEGFPKNLGIDPSLKGKTAVEKALKFMSENTYTQLMDIPRKQVQFSIAEVGEKATNILSAKDIETKLLGGAQLAIMGGKVYLQGAKERYFLGGVHALTGLFDILSKKKEFSAVEGLQEYAYGILPVVFMGTVTSLTRLRNPINGTITETLVRGALYPFSTIWTGGKLVFTDILPHAIDGEFTKILSNPRNAIRTDIMQRVQKVRNMYYEYTAQGNLKNVHSNLGAKLKANSDIYESLRLLYSVENKLGRQTIINQVNKVLVNNQFYKSAEHPITLENFHQVINRLEKIAVSTDEGIKNVIRLNKSESTIQPRIKVDTKQPLNLPELEKRFGTLAKEVVNPDMRSPAKLKELARTRALTNPLEAMKNLSGLEHAVKNGMKLEEASALFRGYEEGINEIVKREIENGKRRLNLPADANKPRISDEQIKNLLERVDANYTNPFKSIKKNLNKAMIETYYAMPTKSKDLAKVINETFRPKSGNILTHISQVSPGGRVGMFGLQAAAMVGVGKSVEYFSTPPEQRDLMKTIQSIASPDTVQLLVDIAPYSGTLSNATSVVTGRKSLEPLANLTGFEFEDGSASRMENLGWFFVSAAGDAATLIPVLGWGAKAGLIGVKLASLVKKGGKVGRAAEEILKVWPKIEKFAGKHGWDKAMQTVVEGLQANRKHLRNINIYGSIGGTAITVGAMGMNLIYDKPVEIQLIPETNSQAQTLSRAPVQIPSEKEKRLAG